MMYVYLLQSVGFNAVLKYSLLVVHRECVHMKELPEHSENLIVCGRSGLLACKAFPCSSFTQS